MVKITGPALLAMALLLGACGSDQLEAEDVAEQAADTEEADMDSVETTAIDDDTGATAPAGGGMSLNGFRYCEIMLSVPGDDGEQVTEVWGTPGVDPCDDADWNALDADVVMAENDASSIHLNGPRYFTVDGTVDTAPGSAGVGMAAGGEAVRRDFGALSMALLATVDGDSTESEAYVPDLVVRTATWTFDAGTEIYELTDPDGNVYVMQSYALYVDPSLTAQDLPTLGDRLDLPQGWSYGARVLDTNLQVALADGGAMVVQDELGNSYQRNG